MAEEVKLHGTWAGPFTRRVELALKLKGVPYQYIDEDISNKSPLLHQYNPIYKKVPVFVHHGRPILESALILEYIDENWKKNPIFPQDPFDRATARFWAKFADDTIFQAAVKASMARAEEEREATIQEFHQNLKLLENQLEGKEFFGGERIGYLDIVVFFLTYWFHVWEEVLQIGLFKEDDFPVLQKWMDKLLALDVFKECIPPRDKHVAYSKARVEAFKSASK